MDKSMLGDLDGLPEEDKMRMAGMIDQLQIRDRFVPYERLLIPES
jgi:import inner membrane translocase subunit TIM9